MSEPSHGEKFICLFTIVRAAFVALTRRTTMYTATSYERPLKYLARLKKAL